MLLLLFVSAMVRLISSQSTQYHFVNQRQTFRQAQSYCRERYTDLATVDSIRDMNSLLEVVDTTITGSAWIGLERGTVWRWHWSLSGHEFYTAGQRDFRNWKSGQPRTDQNQDGCAVMEPSGEWFEDNCSTERRFMCFNATKGTHVLITQNMSWREAQVYCREFHTDLVSARNRSENQAIRKAANLQQVWIGLFKDPWVWSDHSDSSFRFWISSQPNNFLARQDCVAVRFLSAGRWNDVRCESRRRFFCHSVMKTTTPQPVPSKAPETTTTKNQVTTITVATNAPETPQPVTSKAAETTTTSKDQVTTTTMIAYTTVTRQPVTSEEPETTTTENQLTAATVTTHAPGTTTREDESTTVGAQDPALDHVILVRENLTWTEALVYCREHYSDLVSVHSAELQRSMARIARDATTAHIWVGLRFSCTFKFWFWTAGETSGCYQNWAPGHGPHAHGECDVSGALESSDGHHWVSRPNSDRLNFVCFKCPSGKSVKFP